MAFNREAALAEGYTEDEINAYLQAEAAKKNQTAPAVDVGDPPPPTTKIGTVESSPEAMATTGAMAVAPYAVPAAAAGAAALGGSKLYGAWNASAQAAKALADAKLASEQGIENRNLRKMGVPGPVAPQPMPGVAPGAGPIAPGMGAAANEAQMAPKPASMMNRVQAAAANKIQNLPGASMMGSAGKMAGKLLPGVGTALNAADAYNRAQEGDYVGAGIAGLGAAASPFPVVGTAVGAAAGGVNAYRDYLKRQADEKKRTMK